MKRTKRIASVLLALVMALSLITTAFAAEETGSITIDNAVVGQTYTIYQILDLESYNKDSGAYAYKATTAWNAFINSDAIKGTYVSVDAQGYVTWAKTLMSLPLPSWHRSTLPTITSPIRAPRRLILRKWSLSVWTWATTWWIPRWARFAPWTPPILP